MVFRTGIRLISDTGISESDSPVEVNRMCSEDFVHIGKGYHIFGTQTLIVTPLGRRVSTCSVPRTIIQG